MKTANLVPMRAHNLDRTMEDRNDRPEPRNPAPRPATVEELHERIATLHAMIQQLRTVRTDLENERQRLLKENRALRREATLSALMKDLDVSGDALGDGEPAGDDTSPLPAEVLFDRLPARFSFPLYFKRVQDEGIDSETARRCLVHYLREGRLVQNGAYLKKNGARSPDGADR